MVIAAAHEKMLAPRKILWSTPSQVQEVLVEWIELKPGDVVCDVGCGDGRVLIHWAIHASKCKEMLPVKFVGIEIQEERVKEAEELIAKARSNGSIVPEVSTEVICGNALDHHDVYSKATIMFLYLIPRGLRLLKPILLESIRHCDKNVKIITYMSAFPDEVPVEKRLCGVDHQPGAAWPIFLYEFGSSLAP